MIIAAISIQSAGELFYLINEGKRSTPFAELKENTTWNLVGDIENPRKKVLKVGIYLGAHGDQPFH